jgi:hypothetical protein
MMPSGSIHTAGGIRTVRFEMENCNTPAESDF